MYRQFIESRLFSKLIDSYLGDEEYALLQRHLVVYPKAGSVIPGSGGVRKLRWSPSGSGKRGGLRVIYCLQGDRSFWMLTVYRKGDVDVIPGHVLKKIKEAMGREET